MMVMVTLSIYILLNSQEGANNQFHNEWTYKYAAIYSALFQNLPSLFSNQKGKYLAIDQNCWSNRLRI